jgi:hypothetical protein
MVGLSPPLALKGGVKHKKSVGDDCPTLSNTGNLLFLPLQVFFTCKLVGGEDTANGFNH